MLKRLTTASIFLLCFSFSSIASAELIVDFTTAGTNGTAASATPAFTFSSQDLMGGTGVSFNVVASAVIPDGGGANNGDIAQSNQGLGSTVENTGTFLNVIGGVSEVLSFEVTDVLGLSPGETLQLGAILTQNVNQSQSPVGGSYGGAFGADPDDSVTFTSDLGSIVVNATTDGTNGTSTLTDLGSTLLNGNNNTDITGNTFSNAAVLNFTDSFTVAQTTLTANDAIVIQGLSFNVVPSSIPEPSSAVLLGFGGIATLLVRRRRIG